MTAILSTVRAGFEWLLLLPILPVAGLMWLAWLLTCESSNGERSDSRSAQEAAPLQKARPPLPAGEPVSLPQAAADPLAQPRVSRRASRQQRRFLLRLLGHGDYVTEWQMR